MIKTLTTQSASVIALLTTIVLAVDLDSLTNSLGRLLLVSAAVVVALIAALIEVADTARSRPKQFRGRNRNRKILDFMIKLLSSDEQCIISSNDLSWAQGDAFEALKVKAENGSLTLLMPKPNEVSRKLEQLGAKAHYYGSDEFTFRSRFTLINSNRPDGRVAIGFSAKDAHRIRIFEAKDDPAVHLAEDLFKMAKKGSPEVDET